MIELYKANGQNKARAKLLADYKEAVIAKAKQEFEASKQTTTEVVTDDNGDEIVEVELEFVAPEVSESEFDEYLKTRYAELRAAEYPSMKDFADAWVKNDEVGLQAYREKCLAVKIKYPKPDDAQA